MTMLLNAPTGSPRSIRASALLPFLPPMLVVAGGLATYRAAPAVMGWLNPPAKIAAIPAIPVPSAPAPTLSAAPDAKVELPPKPVAPRAPEPTSSPVIVTERPAESIAPAVVGAAVGLGAAAVARSAIVSPPVRAVAPRIVAAPRRMRAMTPRRIAMPSRNFAQRIIRPQVMVQRMLRPQVFMPRVPFGGRGFGGLAGFLGGGRRFGRF